MTSGVAERTYDKLRVRIYPDQAALAAAAARDAAAILNAAIRERGQANLMVATGNAAIRFMAVLRQDPTIEWPKITIFHLDEYLGIAADHPASFRRFIHENLARWVPAKAVHYLQGDAADADAECRRYAALLKQHPIDLCHCGVGENGHLAFNDPPVADFNDPLLVKVVELDEACRRQQVGEGHFPNLSAVPTHALTVTIPGMLAARDVIVVAPEKRKARPIHDALLGPIAPSCPASVLRRQPHAVLYLDPDSASLL